MHGDGLRHRTSRRYRGSTPFVLRGLSFGDPELLSGLVSLYLQTFDNQPCQHSFSRARLRAAHRVAGARPGSRSTQPLSPHARGTAYAQVPDEGDSVSCWISVHRAFMADPERRWRWLAHGVIVARHRLHDDPLALRYARTFRRTRTCTRLGEADADLSAPGYGRGTPGEAAAGALLRDRRNHRPGEIRFLTRRLEDMGALTDTNARGAHRPPQEQAPRSATRDIP